MYKNKKYYNIHIILLISISIIFGGTTFGIQTNVSSLNDYTKNEIFQFSCDTTRTKEIYDGKIGLFTRNFENTSDIPLYLREFRIEGDNQNIENPHIFYNNTNYSETSNGVLVFNYPLLNNLNWTIEPGKKYRHLTTAEEAGGEFEEDPWTFTTGFTFPNYSAGGETEFTKANYFAQGHSNTIKTGSAYDAQVRLLTMYDSDNDYDTTHNNYARVGCFNIQIRRCGDGIYQPDYEECDDQDPNQENWSGGVCVCEDSSGGYCGDGILQTEPQEDLSGPNGEPDGVIDGYDQEQCDNGEDANGNDGICTTNCMTYLNTLVTQIAE